MSTQNKLTSEENMNTESNTEIKAKVLTEDLRKIFEKGVCMLYGIEYDGKYKYSIDFWHCVVYYEEIHPLI